MAGGADLQVDIRRWQVELIKKHLRHFQVVMLTGMQDEFLEASLAEGSVEGGSFDELGPCPEDGHNFQGLSCRSGVDRFGGVNLAHVLSFARPRERKIQVDAPGSVAVEVKRSGS